MSPTNEYLGISDYRPVWVLANRRSDGWVMNDFMKALRLLDDLVEFVEQPETQAVIDGACDPTMAVEQAKDLLWKYAVDDEWPGYAESV